MRIAELRVHNYKSIRNVVVHPTPLAVLVGPNASGKSNLAEAVEFLGQIYRWNLEGAVSRMGGFENICYRHVRRSKQGITLGIKAEIRPDDLHPRRLLRRRRMREDAEPECVLFEHEFTFGTTEQGIAAPFSIEKELVKVIERYGQSEGHEDVTALHCERIGDKLKLFVAEESSQIRQLSLFPEAQAAQRMLLKDSDAVVLYVQDLISQAPSTQLLTHLLPRVMYDLGRYTNILGSGRVYQLNPRDCRGTGVPVPNPELTRYGGNLPAVWRYLQDQHVDLCKQLLAVLRNVMPTLENVGIGYSRSRTLVLEFEERGFGRAWIADDVSDGTIQTFALLVAALDPRTSLVIVEEPENSIHPWALRSFLEALRRLATEKQIILTTHSPVLIDQVTPGEVWLVSRPHAETRIVPLLEVDETAERLVSEGSVGLAEFLDSGAIESYVPDEGE